MSFSVTLHDLGRQRAGGVAVVTMRGNAANVQLLDSTGLSAYRAGRRYNYRGGQVTRSLFRIAILNTSRWYITVDLNGQRPSVTVNSSVQMQRAPLPMARSTAEATAAEIAEEIARRVRPDLFADTMASSA